jgi:hypothetical protein
VHKPNFKESPHVGNIYNFNLQKLRTPVYFKDKSWFQGGLVHTGVTVLVMKLFESKTFYLTLMIDSGFGSDSYEHND